MSQNNPLVALSADESKALAQRFNQAVGLFRRQITQYQIAVNPRDNDRDESDNNATSVPFLRSR